MHLRIYILAFLFVLSSSVQGTHSSSGFPHARRSFAIVKRQSGLFGNLGNGLDGVIDGNGGILGELIVLFD